MRVNRQILLSALESVSPGLSKRDLLEQSSCFVFLDGMLYSFNGEVSCNCTSPLNDFEGAVSAGKLIDLLIRIDEDDLDVTSTKSELLIKYASGKRRTGVPLEESILLPVDQVEKPGKWRQLEADFSDALSMVLPCASDDESQFRLTCINIQPKFLEACDRYQQIRYPCKMPIEESLLIRAASLKDVAQLGMTEMSVTTGWIHFRNVSGLVLSCRRIIDEEYPDLSKYIEHTGGSKITLPGSIDDIIKATENFSSENAALNAIRVELKSGKILFKGEGPLGWHEERRDIEYTGQPMSFLIAPKMLSFLSKKSRECEIENEDGNYRLIVDTGKFCYVSCAEAPGE